MDSPPKPLSSNVYEQIFSAIMEGKYSVNAKLPTESKLCEIHQVSRPILREALARLREDKLIISRRGSGSYVVKKPDDAVLQFARPSSIADIQRCFEFRTALESEAAGLAAARRTSSQMDLIESTYEAMNLANASGMLATDEDFVFHSSITDAAHNHFYSTTLQSLEQSIKQGLNITRNLSLLHSASRLQLVQAEHEAIVQCIRAGNEAGARQAMNTHLNNARIRMFEGIPQE